MTEISDSLRLLFETTLQDEGDRCTISVPKDLVDGGSIQAGETYRVALLSSAADTDADSVSSATTADTDLADGTDTDGSGSGQGSSHHQSPPVEEGEVRSVTIDTLGDQGDGIARVERGFILIVSDTQPGDQVDVKVTDVKDTVAFAEPIEEPTVR